ncbi:unnamed protein product [Polarella glacialis]|uniref:Phosphatidylinositol-specific phospholipase C X domain-containing protein n=1 Tax=Polarella glacialis TaxID=89957 RepID=A0A813EWA9_POLGL|nr:unnamed protein product [Polarella glacialis]
MAAVRGDSRAEASGHDVLDIMSPTVSVPAASSHSTSRTREQATTKDPEVAPGPVDPWSLSMSFSEEDPGKSCVVLFKHQSGEELGPYRVASALLCRGRSERSDFQALKVGTGVHSGSSIYVNRDKVVPMGVRGVIVDQSVVAIADPAIFSQLEKINISIAQGAARDAAGEANAFVRLELGLGQSRSLKPRILQVLRDAEIRFSWRADKTPGLRILQADAEFQPKDDGIVINDVRAQSSGAHRFAAYGTYNFICEQHPEARCTIQVVPWYRMQIWKVMQLVLLPMVLLFVVGVGAYVLVSQFSSADFVSTLFSCKGLESYCDRVQSLKKHIFGSSATLLVISVLLLILYLPTALIAMLKPSPRLDSFGRGYNGDAVHRANMLAGWALTVPIVILIMGWVGNVYLSRGLWSLLGVLQQLRDRIGADINEIYAVLGDALAISSSFKPGLQDSLQPNIDKIIMYEEQVLPAAQLGLQLLTVLIRFRLCMNFLALIFFILAFAKGAGGVLGRSAVMLRHSYWSCCPALILFTFSLGINSFFYSFWKDTHDTYVDGDGNVHMPSGGTSSLAISLIQSCQGDGNIPLPYDSIKMPINTMLDQLASASIVFSLQFPNSTSSLVQFTHDIKLEVETISKWLQMPEASSKELGLDQYNLACAQLVPVLDSLPRFLEKVLVPTLQCQQIGSFINGLIAALGQEILPSAQILIIFDSAMLVCCLLWALIAMSLAYVFERPLKTWYDPWSKRWFRFRFSYKVAEAVRKRNEGDTFVAHRQNRHFLDSSFWAQNLLWLDVQNAVLLGVVACMCLAMDTNGTATSKVRSAGAALLAIASATSLLGSQGSLGSRVNWLLRLVALILLLAATALLSFVAYDNINKAQDCLEKVGFDPQKTGPSASAVSCEAGNANCTFYISGYGLKPGDRLAAVPMGNSCNNFGKLGVQHFLSEPASVFGRRYSFSALLGMTSGGYDMCWCRAGSNCRDPANYRVFSGWLFVNEPLDQWKTCSLPTIAGFSESAFLCLLILPFCLVKLAVGFASLRKSIYSLQISTAMRVAIRQKAWKDNLESQRHIQREQAGVRPTWWERHVMQPVRLHKRSLFAGFLTAKLLAVFAVVSGLVILSQGSVKCKDGAGNCDLPTSSATSTARRLPPPERESCSTCCNLQQSSCSKTVDQVAFATSHNTMSSADLGWAVPNNFFNLTLALGSGVRGLMMDVHYFYPDNATTSDKTRPTAVYLCHGKCSIGRSMLKDSLTDLRQFLDSHPREVVVMILEQYVATASVVADIDAAGLTSYLGYSRHNLNGSTAWPTLQELISRNQSLLLFSDQRQSYTHGLPEQNLGSSYQQSESITWWHYVWDHMSETKYEYKNAAEISGDCMLNRGSVAVESLSQNNSHRLLIVNNFITNPVAWPEFAAQVNANPFLMKRLQNCSMYWGHQVNFPTVDFWSVGDIWNATVSLNA